MVPSVIEPYTLSLTWYPEHSILACLAFLCSSPHPESFSETPLLVFDALVACSGSLCSTKPYALFPTWHLTTCQCLGSTHHPHRHSTRVNHPVLGTPISRFSSAALKELSHSPGSIPLSSFSSLFGCSLLLMAPLPAEPYS